MNNQWNQVHQQVPVVRGWANLTNDELGSCDDLLVILNTKHLIQTPIDDQYRQRFWDRVFAQWTTAQWLQKPAMVIGERTGQNWLFYCGTAKEDCVSDEKARAANQAAGPSPVRRGRGAGVAAAVGMNLVRGPAIPAHRRRGAQLFMKGSLRSDEGYPSVFLCDVKHAKVASRHLQLLPGLDDGTARASTIDLFDRLEIDRVFNYNVAIAIFYAQRRIKRKRMLEAGLDHEANVTCPGEEDLSVFYQLETLRAGLQDYVSMLMRIVDSLGPVRMREI